MKQIFTIAWYLIAPLLLHAASGCKSNDPSPGNPSTLDPGPIVQTPVAPKEAFNDAAYFDHKYLADSSFLFESKAMPSYRSRIRNKQRVGVIRDLAGTKDLLYSGDDLSPLTDGYPTYYKPFSGKEGYIFIDNVFNEKFTTTTLTPAMKGQRELWIVMRRPGIAAGYEAYLNDFNAGYFADRGADRIGLSSVSGDAVSPEGDTSIPLYAKSLVRIKLNGGQSEIFINNMRVTGPLAGGYFSEGHNMQWDKLSVGASTNNAYWDWYGSYFKRGNFTAEEAAKVYQALAERHEIGTLPRLPYASDIAVVKKGNTYEMKYKFNNPLGFPEDTTKTEFRIIWGGKGGGANIVDAYYLPDMEDLRRFNRLDYRVGNSLNKPELFSPVQPFSWFRMTVKVYDTAGNSWRFQTSRWVIDNTY